VALFLCSLFNNVALDLMVLNDGWVILGMSVEGEMMEVGRLLAIRSSNSFHQEDHKRFVCLFFHFFSLRMICFVLDLCFLRR